jgi:hypothetical protein
MTMALMLSLFAAVPAPPAPTAGRVQTFNHYAIEIPAGYVVKDVSPPMTDFDLYQLIDGKGKVKCGLYFGNAPKFPTYKWGSKLPVETRDASRAKKAFQSSTRMEGVLKFSGLTYKTTPDTPFSMIHFFADGLSTDEIKAFSAMVDSIHVVQKHLE